jgi:hypothetical protein
MGLIVSAQVVRDLISEGDYVVESIEQHEHGRVAVSLALRSRAQPYTIRIETGDSRLEGLFRALLNGQGRGSEKPRGVMAGSQPVPVVEVEAMPADQPKRRRQRRAEASVGQTAHPPQDHTSEAPATPARRRRSAIRQLVLVSQDSAPASAQTSERPKRRARASAAASAPGR